MALEGRLLSGKDGKIYVVWHGVRHWIVAQRWIAESGYAKQSPMALTDAELEAIPLGRTISYVSRGDKIALCLLAVALFAFFAWGRRLKDSKAVRVVLAALFIVAMALREPYLLQHPRFWAEEGLIWFQFASTHSILQTLFFVCTVSNYYVLTPNIGAVLSSQVAAHFGLLYAPVPTTYLALLMQALAVVAIFFIKSRLFTSLWRAVTGCLILLFAATTTDDIWLNSINSMVFLGAVAIVLLFADWEAAGSRLRWAYRGLLLFAGLSSPYAVALLPVFFLSAWRLKIREQKVQCLILLFCAIVDTGAVVQSRILIAKAKTDPMRGTVVRLDASAVNMFVEHMLYPAVGYSLRERVLEVSGLKEASSSATSFPPRPLTRTLRTGGWLSLFVIAGTLTLLRGRQLLSTTNWVMAVFLVLSIFTCVASLYSVPTNRYAFLPGFCFLLLLMLNIDGEKPAAQRYACAAVLAVGLAAGMVAYQKPVSQEGPPWSGEVAKWEANPDYSLRVWPSFFVQPVNITYQKNTGSKP